MKFNFKKKYKKIMFIILSVLLFIFVLISIYLFVGFKRPVKDIKWGVCFSQMHSEKLGLDWKKTYLALLNDLGARNIKIGVHWDFIEVEEGKYYFEDLDWQIEEAKKRQARILLVIGMKTPRWPECHIPNWAKNLSKESQQEKILKLLEQIVLRYKDEDSIWAWQIENEPFFPFGECPWEPKEIIKKEVELVKSLDPQRPIVVSDTGELSLWFKAAKIGDIVGTTMYQKVFSPEYNLYFSLPYPSVFYSRKAKLIKLFFRKEVICVELQVEPWGPGLLYYSSLEEQEKTMNLKQFQKNIEFAKRTGLKEFYLWGAEWWYWMKEKQGKPEIWEEAKKLFLSSHQ